MNQNSNQYYYNQKKKSVLYWEKHRKNKMQFVFKRAIIDGLIYGLGLQIVIYGLPNLNNIYIYSITFGIYLLFFLVFIISTPTK